MATRFDSNRKLNNNGDSTTSQRMERLMQQWREGEAAAAQKVQAELAKIGNGSANAAVSDLNSKPSANPDTELPSAKPDLGAAKSGVRDNATGSAPKTSGGEAAAAVAAATDSGMPKTGTPDTELPSAKPDLGAAKPGVPDNATGATGSAEKMSGGEAAAASAAAATDSGMPKTGTPDTELPSAKPDLGAAKPGVPDSATGATGSAEKVSGGEAAAASAAATDSGMPKTGTPDTELPSAKPDLGAEKPGVRDGAGATASTNSETANANSSAAMSAQTSGQHNESVGTVGMTVVSNRGTEKAKGTSGDDMLVDAGATGNGVNPGDDTFLGFEGDDTVFTRWGRDVIDGGEGNDVIYSRSDAGEPEVAEPGGTGIYFNNQPFNESMTDDTLNGGTGDDTYVFRIDIAAKVNILAKHAGKAGEIDWAGVTGENNLDHDHWVEAFGKDAIKDFSRSGAGGADKITITGHTTQVKDIVYEDRNGDGKLDSIIQVISDQGPGGGAHNQDVLGEIVVLGDGTDNSKLTMDDVNQDGGGTADDLIQVNAGAHHGLYENIDEMFLDAAGNFPSTNYVKIDGKQFILGSKGSDNLVGDAGEDYMIDLGTYRDRQAKDSFTGGDGADVIRTRWGRDTVDGGNGDDLIVSRSDAGEPVPQSGTGASAKYFNNQPFKNNANDKLTGGEGADTFFFRLDLNARPEVVARNLHDYSENHDHGHGDFADIDWEDVTGENDATHLHWLESIGTDVITDFSKAEGDTIELAGHTVEIASFTTMRYNKDKFDDIVIQLRSQQGAAGSHDEDLVGQIVILGDGTADTQLSAADIGNIIKIDAVSHYGAYGNFDEMLYV
jgi:Ca2+-binding RTX toxin-like protein